MENDKKEKAFEELHKLYQKQGKDKFILNLRLLFFMYDLPFLELHSTENKNIEPEDGIACLGIKLANQEQLSIGFMEPSNSDGSIIAILFYDKRLHAWRNTNGKYLPFQTVEYYAVINVNNCTFNAAL